MDSFSNFAPFLLIITLMICIIIGKNITKKDLFTIDGAFSLFGCLVGIFMTLLNLKYVSKDLFLLSPLIAITCITYLRFRDKLFSNKIDFSRPLNNKVLKVINIFYWCSISFALISYIQSPIYHRSPLFFVFVSVSIALIGLLIVYSNLSRKIDILDLYIKVTLVSLILSASAFFVSPYPVGSDLWAHLEYVKNYLHFHSLTVSGATQRVGNYYLTFPISHLFATVISLVTNLNPRTSFYMVGVILILSTIFTYLFVKEMYNNSNIALFSLFLISFADCHIHWTDQVIAMSFGLAVYSIIIYLLIKSHSTVVLSRNKPIYVLLLTFFILFIIWTHTISAFITLITITCLHIMYLVNQKIFHNKNYEDFGGFTLYFVMTIALVYHWTDPSYSFLNKTILRLFDSLAAEAGFLDSNFSSNVTGSYEMLLLPIGFLIYTFFGIIGSLFTLSEFKYFTKKTQLLFTTIVLYVIRYAFPIFGLRNVIPDRWPPFIYVIFILYITLGFLKVTFSIKSRMRQIIFVFVILLSSSFFMITDGETNVDSPLYGENVIQRLVWTDSEISLFTHVNEYDNVIYADHQTESRPFETYLYRDTDKVMTYPVNNQGDIEWNIMSKNMTIWRKTSLNRPVSCSLGEMVLGYDFEAKLDDNFNCVYNTGEAKAFI